MALQACIQQFPARLSTSSPGLGRADPDAPRAERRVGVPGHRGTNKYAPSGTAEGEWCAPRQRHSRDSRPRVCLRLRYCTDILKITGRGNEVFPVEVFQVLWSPMSTTVGILVRMTFANYRCMEDMQHQPDPSQPFPIEVYVCWSSGGCVSVLVKPQYSSASIRQVNPEKVRHTKKIYISDPRVISCLLLPSRLALV